VGQRERKISYTDAISVSAKASRVPHGDRDSLLLSKELTKEQKIALFVRVIHHIISPVTTRQIYTFLFAQAEKKFGNISSPFQYPPTMFLF